MILCNSFRNFRSESQGTEAAEAQGQGKGLGEGQTATKVDKEWKWNVLSWPAFISARCRTKASSTCVFFFSLSISLFYFVIQLISPLVSFCSLELPLWDLLWPDLVSFPGKTCTNSVNAVLWWLSSRWNYARWFNAQWRLNYACKVYVIMPVMSLAQNLEDRGT